MSDYLGIANRVLERWQAHAQREPGSVAKLAETVPPVESWPDSLLDLAHERAARTGDAEDARQEVWISWCEWKAREMNRLFLEHGLTGEPGRITAETVRDEMERAAHRIAKHPRKQFR
jgi:hypothetical protein